MRGHPECTFCNGSGYDMDTLGSWRACACRYDEAYRLSLDRIHTKRLMTAQKNTEQTVQMTEWDVL